MSARRLPLPALALLLTGLAPPAARAASAATPPRRTNVLFIAVDDLNCALGCYGHPLVKTPNIDRLASRGVRFEHAYCQYPLCNPSRTSFLSGRRPDVTKVLDNNTPPRTTLGKGAVFLPEYFKAQGYFTARVGKIAHGRFEHTVKWDVSEHAVKGEGDKKDKGEDGEALDLTWRATERRDEDEPDGRTARRVVQLLDKHKGGPFFLAAGFHKPHLPFVAPKKYFDLYPPERIALPKEPAGVRKGVPAVAFTHTKGDETMTDRQKRQAIAAYYACVSFIDAQVGVLLEAMDRLKLWDNTVVVFLSDHGFHLGEHGGLWRKMCLFEEATHVPLLIAAPGKKPGTSPRLAELLDLYPTLTDLCGLPAPAGLEGRSLKPLLDDPKRAWDRAVAYTIVARDRKKGEPLIGRTVRSERYRYTEWGDEKQAELYDHRGDPRELRNLANDVKHAAVLAQMRRHLQGRWKPAAAAK
jgi:uncharacterized sulfatase